MKNGIKYKDTWLMKGSKARDLYDNKEFEKLDKHLKQLDKEYKELHYGKTVVNHV